jgi:hypothetical protein
MYKHSLKFELTHWTHETQRNVYYAGADVYDDEVYSLLAWLETVSSSITLALGRKEAAETAGSAAVFSGCCDFTRITHPLNACFQMYIPSGLQLDLLWEHANLELGLRQWASRLCPSTICTWTLPTTVVQARAKIEAFLSEIGSANLGAKSIQRFRQEFFVGQAAVAGLL